MALGRDQLQANGKNIKQQQQKNTPDRLSMWFFISGEKQRWGVEPKADAPAVFLDPSFRCEPRGGRHKSIHARKPREPATSSRGEGILTAPADVDEQIALEDGATLEHLSGRHRVDGLRLLFFLTDFGARAFARDAVHAVEDKEPAADTKVRMSPCTGKILSTCFYAGRTHYEHQGS